MREGGRWTGKRGWGRGRLDFGRAMPSRVAPLALSSRTRVSEWQRQGQGSAMPTAVFHRLHPFTAAVSFHSRPCPLHSEASSFFASACEASSAGPTGRIDTVLTSHSLARTLSCGGRGGDSSVQS